MRSVALTLLLTVLSTVSVCANASDNGSRDWSSLSPDARSGILTALKRAEGHKGNWVQLATLRASNGQPTAALGFSVAMDGDTIVVGAPYLGFYKGEVYVFVKPSNGWTILFFFAVALVFLLVFSFVRLLSKEDIASYPVVTRV